MGVPRKVRQIAVGLADGTLYALADDGSLWWSDPRGAAKGWRQVQPLPEAEACPAKQSYDPERPAGCIFAAGHRDAHWNGHRNWT